MAIDFKSSINLGGNQLQNAAIHPTGSAPSSPSLGQIYFNTTSGSEKLYIYNGAAWVDVTGDITSISAGTGISVTNGSGGDATVALSHLGIQNLGAPESDSILFYDTSSGSGTSAWLNVDSNTGVRIDGTDLELYQVPNASLANSSITINGGDGITATAGATSLGDSTTIAIDLTTDSGLAFTSNKLSLKNVDNLVANTVPMWDDTNAQFTNAKIVQSSQTVGENLEYTITVTSETTVIQGNLVVEGTTTSVDSNTVTIGDNIIVLNADATGTATQNAGIEIERGDDANKIFQWNEASDYWETLGAPLKIGSLSTNASATTSTYVLTQGGGVTTPTERISVDTIGTLTGANKRYSVLMDSLNRDNVARTVSSNTYTYTINHGLGSKYVMVEIVDSANFATAWASVERPTDNSVKVVMTQPTDPNGNYICMVWRVDNVDTTSTQSGA